MEVEKFDIPLILKPLETMKVNTKPLSLWHCNGEELDMSKLLYSQNIILYVTTNSKVITCKTLRHNSFTSYEKFKKLKSIAKSTMTYNNQVYTKNVLFAIDYLDKGLQKTVFVFENGWMSNSIMGVNALQEDFLSDKKLIENFYNDKGLKVFVRNLKYPQKN